jgi:hypothetical protein
LNKVTFDTALYANSADARADWNWRATSGGAPHLGAAFDAVRRNGWSTQVIAHCNLANNGAGVWHKAGFEDKVDRAKTFHDIRGTFAAGLMTLPGGSPTDAQIPTNMGWSARQVGAVRKRYVDEAAIVVAIAERISRAVQNVL